MRTFSRPRVKICCISSVSEARLAIKYGASALGLVSEMPSGPGVIGEDAIAEIAASVPPPVSTFLLTSKSTVEDVASQLARCRTNTVQLVDEFHEPYADRIGDAKYVGLETPDGEYYVGWDLDAILHPQTMLALEQDGAPLDQDHGAPIRLASPNKYGIKTIKRIKRIRYSNERTADYWAERSYDWYAGL